MWPLLVDAVIVCILLYYYWRLFFPYDKWKNLNVPHIPPHFIWGNFKDVMYQNETYYEAYQKFYRTFPDAKYVGFYVLNRSSLLICDPQLIKDVVQTNFAHFYDNDFSVDEKVDPIFGTSPFTLKGDRWKTRRAIHTPQFSSGKIKYMFVLIGQAGDRMVKFLNDKIGQNNYCTIESMELASKYTIFNVANCSMGIDPGTFDEEHAELREIGRRILQPRFRNALKQLFVFVLPDLANFLSIQIVSTEATNTFRRLARETLQYRKENSIVINDFFQSIQEYKGEKRSVDDMIVQIGGLFLDGFATNSSALTFMLYELAINEDIQRRLREEIDEVLEKHNGTVPYDVFQKMQYLDAVFSEGLRKYPGFPSYGKLCTKTYTFPPAMEGGAPVTIERGTPIVIPVFALHHDERHFPDPERFDPMRFMGENKAKIQEYTYLPFNEGPRTCLGKRFGMIQSKMMLLKLVSDFDIKPNPKTETPLKYGAQGILLAPKAAVWLDISKRKRKPSFSRSLS